MTSPPEPQSVRTRGGTSPRCHADGLSPMRQNGCVARSGLPGQYGCRFPLVRYHRMRNGLACHQLKRIETNLAI